METINGQTFKAGTTIFLDAVLALLTQQEESISGLGEAILGQIAGDGELQNQLRKAITATVEAFVSPIAADIGNLTSVKSALGTMTDDDAQAIVGDGDAQGITMRAGEWIGKQWAATTKELLDDIAESEQSIADLQADVSALYQARTASDTQWGGLLQFWRAVPDAIKLKIATGEITPEIVIQLFQPSQPRGKLKSRTASAQFSSPRGLTSMFKHE